MTPPPASQAGPAPGPTTEPAPSYAELLAASEARRRSRDDRLLRTMIQLRDPMPPGT